MGENADFLRHAIRALDAGDPSVFLDAYDSDVVLVVWPGGPRALDVGTHVGKDSVENWFAEWFRSFRRGRQHEPTEMIEVGDSVVTFLTETYTGRRSGIELSEDDVPAIYTLRAGKIIRIDLPPTREEALALVGLGPT